MPYELLRDVVGHRDPAYVSRRRWFVLPLSIVAHAAAGLAVMIIPLAAQVELPRPAPLSRDIRMIAAAPVPTSPSINRPRAARAAVSLSRLVAPTVAPSTIEPEAAVEIPPGASAGPAVHGGFGIGTATLGSVEPIVPPAPPAPVVRQAPLRIGEGIRAPSKIVNVAPTYPVVAQTARLEGVVVLEATIDERGSVERLRVVRSAPLFDQAALDAVSRWRFTPTLLNGVPVPVLMTVTVNFKLSR